MKMGGGGGGGLGWEGMGREKKCEQPIQNEGGLINID